MITSSLYASDISYRASLSSHEISSVGVVYNVDRLQTIKGHFHFDKDNSFPLFEYQRLDVPVKAMVGSLVNHRFDNRLMENVFLREAGLYIRGEFKPITARFMAYPFLVEKSKLYYGSAWYKDYFGIGLLHESLSNAIINNALNRSTMSISAQYSPQFFGFSSGTFRLFNLFFDTKTPMTFRSDLYLSHSKGTDSKTGSGRGYKLSGELPYTSTTYKHALSFEYVSWTNDNDNTITYNSLDRYYYQYPFFEKRNNFRNQSASYSQLKFNAVKSFFPFSIVTTAIYIPSQKMHFGRLAARYQRFSKFGLEFALSKSSDQKDFNASFRAVLLGNLDG